MDKPVLVLKGVRKELGGRAVLESIDLSLSRGRVLALCGGNGAGKSTLLRLITGMLQPTSGTIELNGLQWGANRARYADQLGYMPDDYLFGQGLSAHETLSFWAALRKVPKKRVAELLELVGLSEVKHKAVTSFSKGMRQRLLFAQALLAKPPLLVMDEPTNGLDPYWMDAFVELVRQSKQEGHAILFSTHQLRVAELAADEAVFLQGGRLVRQDRTDVLGGDAASMDARGLETAFAELYRQPMTGSGGGHARGSSGKGGE
ncbi:ABC transporter ATP-binding protein [Paenibacillus sp. YYML68]|uniref:ABC transporter ATP-binding protein n=1 Tax=Paenibacillus sp. YYML68 TaxID=2909250 RepID=UPI002493C4A8|nr:ABC transporter ATP-binding protein [Paenibacillus sp. YYML68]